MQTFAKPFSSTFVVLALISVYSDHLKKKYLTRGAHLCITCLDYYPFVYLKTCDLSFD